MTEAQQKRYEYASQVLSDIGALRQSKPFTGYFLRRMGEKIATAERVFRYEPDEKLKDKGGREGVRQVLLAYEELAQMISADEAMARRVVESADGKT